MTLQLVTLGNQYCEVPLIPSGVVAALPSYWNIQRRISTEARTKACIKVSRLFCSGEATIVEGS